MQQIKANNLSKLILPDSNPPPPRVLEKLTSMTKAMQYAKVNFYGPGGAGPPGGGATLKNLIDSLAKQGGGG